jgi:hypothetical protein
MKALVTAVTAATALWVLSPEPAQSMSLVNLGQAARDVSPLVQNVGYVCGPYRCWWRPGYGYGPVNVVGGVPYCYGWIGYGACAYVGSAGPYGWAYRGWW